jgi:hypothetical protein
MDDAINIGQAIRQFLQKSNIKGDMQVLRLQPIWEDIMGVTCAKYTSKLEIFQKKLIVHTKEAALRQEIVYAKEKIIERINEAFGEKVINEVVVR